MASKRMFSPSIVRSDAFITMPISTRLLYYDLSMDADDDGFVDKPHSIIRMTGASTDDLKLLIAKAFVIPFESGIIVIKHWRINNYLRPDRYKPTNYIEEKSQLVIKENGAYTLKKDEENLGIPSGIPLVGVDKSSIDKISIDIYNTANAVVEGSKKTKYDDIQTQINNFTNDEELKNILNEFVNMRKKVRKNLTNYAFSLILKKLNKEAGNDINLQKDILNQSITNGWLDIYPLIHKGYERKFNKKVKPTGDWQEDYEKELKEKVARNKESSRVIEDVDVKELVDNIFKN